MAGSLILVDPAAEESVVEQSSLAPRLESLAGARIALIDNSKHMVGPLLAEVEKLLKERYGIAGISYYRKKNPSIPTPPEVLRQLAGECVAVVHGVAD